MTWEGAGMTGVGIVDLRLSIADWGRGFPLSRE